MADDGNTEGLVELDIDNQEEFNRIVRREKRKLDEFLQHSTAEILNKMLRRDCNCLCCNCQ